MPGGLRLRCPAGLAGWPGWLAGLAGWLGWLDWLGWMEGMRKFSHARRSEEVGGFGGTIPVTAKVTAIDYTMD